MRQTSPEVFSVEQCAFHIYQTWVFSCRSAKCSPGNKQTPSDRLTANCWTIGKLSNLQRYTVGFVFSRACKLAVTHSILTWSKLYILQDFPLLFVIILLSCSKTASNNSTKTSARYNWIQIEPNNTCFIQWATLWDTGGTQSPDSRPQRWPCSQPKLYPGCTFKNGP